MSNTTPHTMTEVLRDFLKLLQVNYELVSEIRQQGFFFPKTFKMNDSQCNLALCNRN